MTYKNLGLLSASLAAAAMMAPDVGSGANVDADLIASLGLADTSAPAETSAADAAADKADNTEVVSKGARSEVKIDAAKITKARGRLPALERNGGGGGKRGSKYPFESLGAPTEATDDEGKYWEYDSFDIRLADVENADAKKLRTAIQAAVAAQNKQEKEANSTIKYVSRTTTENGEYVGSAVYRVDQTLEEDEDDTPETAEVTETAAA